MPRPRIREPRTRKAWENARRRCRATAGHWYRYYAAKGITMCDRWEQSFSDFLADMGDCPPGHSLDRIDGSRGYEPGNCRWATHTEQMNNTSANRRLTYCGETKTLAEWARHIGMDDYRPLWLRIVQRRWSVERALTTPLRSMAPRLLTHEGRTQSVRAWAEELGVPKRTLASRLDCGWSLSDALSPDLYPRGRAPRLTLHGETRTMAQWARRTGLSVSTIYRRHRDGWPVERVLHRHSTT